MAISAGLNAAILKALKIARPTLSRRARRLAQRYGPMSGDEARWIIAHEAGIDLRKHGLSQAQLDRVRELRPRVEVTEPQLGRDRRHGAAKSVRVPTAARELAPTPSAIFNARGYHPAIDRSSRRLFVGGYHTEAIHRAFQSVNNRVKRLSGIAEDGQKLMSKTFSEESPALQMTGLSNESEVDEHNGTRFMMMGAMAGLRNPRAHEEGRWQADNDPQSVLEALSFASLLHRFLDRCEAYAVARTRPPLGDNGTARGPSVMPSR
jgi:uncharacterized protein (TIGR02391 family)